MDEWEALSLISGELGTSDDCAVVPWQESNLLLTTDMIHEETDLPDGVNPEVTGWRSVAVSLSDVAAMGGEPMAAVVAIGTPEFERESLMGVVGGVRDVCRSVGAEYVGGDLDRHSELTIVGSVLGSAQKPVPRGGAEVGDAVCITGELGRTTRALELFGEGDIELGNELFAFDPRVAEGQQIAPYATAMMDISDGLAVTLHQMMEAGDTGFSIRSSDLPIMDEVSFEDGVFFGEDYELVFTVPEGRLSELRGFDYSVVGECVEDGVWIDGEELEKRGFEH